MSKGLSFGSELRLWLAMLGVAALARAAMGLRAYPYGDDLVYGPLAKLSADPGAFSGDEHLRAFDNHAWLYSLFWRGAEATIGAPLGF
ncbi:MAG: hypothetical protein AAF401_15285, partial [Pseudomonadota bacterium]